MIVLDRKMRSLSDMKGKIRVILKVKKFLIGRVAQFSNPFRFRDIDNPDRSLQSEVNSEHYSRLLFICATSECAKYIKALSQLPHTPHHSKTAWIVVQQHGSYASGIPHNIVCRMLCVHEGIISIV